MNIYTAQIDNGFAMTQVAYGSTGSYLSYVGPYPYYMRVCPDDAFQGKVLGSLVYQKFGWESVTTFATTDSAGSDGITQFNIQAAAFGINILSSHTFRVGTLDFTSHIKSAKNYGARIFVFYVDTASAAR